MKFEFLEKPEFEGYKFPKFRKAYEVASIAHKNQKRKDGQPYMNHVDAVITNTFLRHESMHHINHAIMPCYTYALDLYLVVAALHDVFEDCPEYDVDEVMSDIMKPNIADKMWSAVWCGNADRMCIDAVKVISKSLKGIQQYEHYSEYVLKVKSNGIACCVKAADLIHNMSDLGKGNMLDKYDLTLHVLNSL